MTNLVRRWQHRRRRRRCPCRPNRRCWCRPPLLGLRLHALHPSSRRRGHVGLLLYFSCDHAEPCPPRASTRPHVRRARPQLHVPPPHGRQRVWRAPRASWLYTPGQLLKYASTSSCFKFKYGPPTSSCPPKRSIIFLENQRLANEFVASPQANYTTEQRTNGPFVRCLLTCSLLVRRTWWRKPHADLLSIFYVTLPAVWLVLAVEHTIKRGKLAVSGGVTRGRVARGVIGVTTPTKDMTSQAQAQKQPKAGPGRATATGREAFLHFEGLTSQQQTRNGWPPA